ncbi:MAG TPA: hypothetical protein VIC62_22735, partial [Nakamurella sp.]
MALEGDVIGSRIPPPRNITEIGGYMNLLGTLQQTEMRQQALAGILGVAGPNPPLGWLTNDQPLAFVTLSNDRPAGPAQASIPLTFVVRSDFVTAVQSVFAYLHHRGCSLPIGGPTLVSLPQARPGLLTPGDPLPYIGRTLDLAAGVALLDPESDALALVRSATTDPFQIAANVLSAATATIPTTAAAYDGLQCDSTSCSPVS